MGKAEKRSEQRATSNGSTSPCKCPSKMSRIRYFHVSLRRIDRCLGRAIRERVINLSCQEEADDAVGVPEAAVKVSRGVGRVGGLAGWRGAARKGNGSPMEARIVQAL
jgi:hypothetical protein